MKTRNPLTKLTLLLAVTRQILHAALQLPNQSNDRVTLAAVFIGVVTAVSCVPIDRSFNCV
jgi:hypothetical protein